MEERKLERIDRDADGYWYQVRTGRNAAICCGPYGSRREALEAARAEVAGEAHV